jgi:hypothetical protein
MKNRVENGVLEPDQIIETLLLLGRRIQSRFPKASLNESHGRLLSIARRAKRRAEAIAEPLIALRIGVSVLVVVLLVAPVLATLSLETPREALDLYTAFELVDHVARNVALIAVGIFFLLTLESRIKRTRVLKATRELRNIAHIIDMHQLSKDPDHALRERAPAGRVQSSYEMSRYLEYCNELLALTGKIAAVYVQNFDDEGAVQAVNEIETLTAGMCQRIWQKILILHQETGTGGTGSHPTVEAA